MKQKQVNYTVEELKDKVLHYDSAMNEAYEVRDGNLYLMYKDLRDTFLERLYTAQRRTQCKTNTLAK
jgi:hypothetical protein